MLLDTQPRFLKRDQPKAQKLSDLGAVLFTLNGNFVKKLQKPPAPLASGSWRLYPRNPVYDTLELHPFAYHVVRLRHFSNKKISNF